MRRLGIQLLLLSCVVFAAAGCGDDGDDIGHLSVKITGEPVIERKSGKTVIYVTYLVRLLDGQPLARNEFDIRQLQDGSDLDVESVGDESNAPLKSSLNYHLVLDKSYSMLTHQPPAFGPMLDAAGDSINTIRQLWEGNGGQFHHGVTLFDEWVYAANGSWTSTDLASVPPPAQGTATKLFCATDFAVNRMVQDLNNGIASGERDRHIMIVFSDGADNYSHYDQSGDPAPDCPMSGNGGSCVTTTGAEYEIHGTGQVALASLESAISAHGHLTVNTLGLGTTVKDDELGRIAAAGGGEYIHNPDTSATQELFRSALQQFIDEQTVWFQIPEPEGTHELTLDFSTKGPLEPANTRCRVRYTTVGTPEVTEYSCGHIVPK